MKINLDAPIPTLDGGQLKVRLEDGTLLPLTLRDVVCTALTKETPNARIAEGQKVIRWALALQMHKGGEQEITPENATIIRKAIDAIHPIEIAGPAIPMLSG